MTKIDAAKKVDVRISALIARADRQARALDGLLVQTQRTIAAINKLPDRERELALMTLAENFSAFQELSGIAGLAENEVGHAAGEYGYRSGY